MTGLPAVPPGLVAEAVEALPTRLRKKLDEVVARAAGWPVSTVDGAVTVTIDDATTVTLRVPVMGADDVACSCLMAPRCAHRAAVLSLAPASDGAAAASDETVTTASGDAVAAGSRGGAESGTASGDPAAGPPTGAAAGPLTGAAAGPLTGAAAGPLAGAATSAAPAAASGGAAAGAAREAAADGGGFGAAEVAAAVGLWTAGTALLGNGLAGAGAVRQAVLLRAAHEARALGLHRASTAAIRVVEAARAARADDPAFRLADLVAALRELLTVSHRIRLGLGAPAGLRGVARRSFVECGDLRLYGLCCVPILDRTGYAGAVTYLSDARGTLFQLGEVTPGGAELATGRPDNPVHIGEARLTFRELGRAGLFVSAARASADGRLSVGKGVRAVRGSGVAWTEPPLAGFWARPLAEQVGAFHEALRMPLEERPAGHDLAFLTGRMGAASADEVRFDTAEGHPVRLVAPTDDPALPYLPNLRMLAEVSGEVRLIGRFAPAGRVEALAAGWAGLPSGHVDLGAERLTRALLPAPTGESTVDAAAPVGSARVTDLPLYLLSRRVRRAVEGGGLAAAGAPGDRSRLITAGLPTAARLAGRLDAAAVPRPRDAYGRPAGDGTDDLGAAWLAAATYLDAVLARQAAAAWLSAS
jgi:hypothetical protein